MTNAIEVGNVLKFKKPYLVANYGETATVTGIQVAESRPFGNKLTLVDLVTANGTKIQWSVRQVRVAAWRMWFA